METLLFWLTMCTLAVLLLLDIFWKGGEGDD